MNIHEGETMKAIGYFESKSIHEEGALLDIKIGIPALKPLDILVRVNAIAVNPVDTKVRKRTKSENNEPVILGWDAAGTVEEVGSEVNNFKVGDQVYYAGSILRQGANSELHAVDSRIVSLKPDNLSSEEAAAIPLTALTSYEALFEQLGIPPPTTPKRKIQKSILIIGGAGGVGSMAIQMAKLAGLQVITTASRPETVEWTKKLGADIILDHRQPLMDQLKNYQIKNVDYIFNTVSTELYWTQMAELIRPFGKIVSIVESKSPIDLTLLMQKSITFSWELMFTRSMFETEDISKQGEILSTVAKWIVEGHLITTKSEVWSPIDAKNLIKAHQVIESGKSIGKIVLKGWKE